MEDLTENTIDWDLNINFSHITEAPENKDYTFCIINDEKGKIPRLQAKGWRLWDKGDTGGYVDKIGPTLGNKSAAKKEPEEGTMYSSVPVGMAGTDKPCVAYLMFMPNEEYQVKITEKHVRNAKRQIDGVTVQARAHAAAQGVGSDAVVKPEGTLTKSTNSDVAQGNS